jgi:hypothetical protein
VEAVLGLSSPEATAEIRRGREIASGEEIGEIAADLVDGAGLRFLARVVITEMGMRGRTRGTAPMAIGKRERTQTCTILGAS